MQKAKVQYVVAGVQGAADFQMNVRGHVYIPDGEVYNDSEDERRPYCAVYREKRPREAIMVSKRAAVVMLVLLFVVFAALIIAKVQKRMELNSYIAATETNLAALNAANASLQLDVTRNREKTRISHLAEGMHMVPPTAVEMVSVIAPQTRVSQDSYMVRGGVPALDGNGTISGSK